MSSQIQITGETKVKSLTGVLVGTSGVVSSLNIDGSLGIPQLDVNGKILVSQLPNSVMEYKGTWNAATNTPTLVNGTGNQGDVYLCNVAGTVNFGAGAIAFFVGDQVIYSGSIWQRASGATGTVTSVAVTETGDSLNITGSPITTSGTINIGFNGTNLQYINGAGDLTTFPTLSGYVTSVTGTAPVVSSGGTTPAISMPAATTSVNGYLASADFTTFNNKQNAITLTTTGTSGASTLVGATLNIPNYGSALTGYVPYTGATTDVDLGAFKLNAQSLHAKGTAGNGHLGLKHQSASATASANEVSLFADSLGDLGWLNGNLYLSKFITSSNTAARSYTFPDASGTIALTSNLSAYLPLAGGTLTGNLGIQKTSGIATISFPIPSGGNDAAFIQHEETTVDTGIMRFSVSDNDLINDYFVFGNTQTGTFLERFKITATGVVTLGTWNGSAITDSYISSASTWNNKLNLSGGTLTGTLNSNSLIYTSLNFKTDSSVAFKNITSGGTAPSALAGYSQLFFDTYQLSIRKADNQIIYLRYPNSATTQTWDLNVEGYIAVQYLASQTTGGVSFVRSTGQFTQDATKFFWDDTNKRLAIGNAAPSYTLDVSGTGRFTGALTTGGGVNIGATSFTSPSGADTILGVYGGQDCSLILQDNVQLWELYVNDDFYINRGATTALTILRSNGNVGIGTTSPSSLLHLQSSASGGQNLRIQTSIAAGRNYVQFANGSGDMGYFGYGGADGKFFIVNQLNADMLFYTNDNPRMTITSGGNVGIGSSTFTFAATGRTNLVLNGSTDSLFEFQNGGSSRAYLYSNTDGLEINSVGSRFLQFVTNAEIRMKIFSTGKVTIQTAIAGDITFLAQNTSSTGYGAAVQGGNGGNYSFIVRKYDTTDYFEVRGNGGVSMPVVYSSFSTGSAANLHIGAGGALYVSTSSIKYKKDIRNYDKGLAEVLKMRPVYYKGISDYDGDTQFAGLIAEEIQELGLTEFVQYEEDGSPRSLAYASMVTLLTKAIQELSAKNDTLETRLQLLENKIL